MSEKIISPSTFIQENDQTFLQKGISSNGAALVGPTVKGSPLIPVKISSYNEYISSFGTTFKSGSQYYQYLTSYTAKQYFDNGGKSLWVVPIKSGSYSQFSTYASASVRNGTPTSNGNYASASVTITNDITSSFPWTSIYLNPISKLNVFFHPYAATGSNYYDNVGSVLYVGVLGANSLNNYAKHLADAFSTGSISSFFSGSYNSNVVTIKSQTQGTVPNSYSITSSMQWMGFIGSGNGVSSSFSGGTNPQYQNNSFTIETLSYGTLMNNTSSLSVLNSLDSGSSDNIRWEISDVNTGSGVFTLLIRSGNDSQNSKNILEIWNNLSLDPGLSNFITKVIGDTKNNFYKDPTTGEIFIQESGSYKNSSQFIRIKSVDSIIIDSIDNDGNFKATQYSGSLPLLGSGSYGGSFSGGIDGAGVKHPQYMNENITISSTNSQGLTSADYIDALNLISNKDQYDYNLLLLPGLTANNSNLSGAISNAISITENRGDCFVIFDIVSYGANINSVINNSTFSNSNYAGTYWPWLQIKDTENDKNIWVPPSTVVGGAYAFNDNVSAPWFAPAGLLRGGLSQVIKAERKLSKTDRDNLYNVNINPIASFPGQGINLLGQKTMQKKSSSLDRINVRRLLISIKEFISKNSNQLIFEQNTITTRNKFLSIVEPYLDSVVEKQGLYAYKLEIGDDINTPDVIDRNELRVQLYIQPTRTIEFIIVNINLTPTGADIS